MNLPLPELEDWKPVSRVGGIAWIILFLLFLFYAAADATGFLFPDYVNLMIHEAGHLLFSWGGETLMLLGGTLGELLAPLACAVFFFWQRQVYGFSFCAFWFFENFLYIGTYMADARSAKLPLVGSEYSDWELLFGKWGLLAADQRIGHTVRLLGWIGMLAVIAWVSYRVYVGTRPALRPLEMN